ncbi:MAB_1171c family putative transporter [Actinoalloteichus caeruleus]|uniref:MAB_1171c family putative transporter n=2 Tax=Actinoalloteichus cyanogriseus TaxID=2893586 RepID=UPI0004BE92AC|nr:MAB_1171c family putative transporter [Actinoalloteichus caeruleus]
MVTALFLTVSLLVSLAAAFRAVRNLRRGPGGNPGRWALVGVLGSLGFAFLVLAPATQAVLAGIYPNIGRLLSNLGTLAAAFSAVMLLLYLAHPPEEARRRAPRRFLVFAVAELALLVLFLAADIPESRGLFGEYYSTHPTLAGYVLVYSAYLGAVLVDLAWLGLRYSNATGGSLRIGLRVLAVGCVLGLSYVAEKLYSTTRAALEGPETGSESYCVTPFDNFGCAMSVGMPAASVLVMTVGLLLPAVAPIINRLVRAPGEWRAYRELRPLWAALYEAVPEIALTSPDAVKGDYGRRDVGMRLYRRVIEIRDGVLALRPYRDPSVAEQVGGAGRAAGLTGEDLAATVEAAVISAAIAGARSGRPVDPGGGDSASPDPGPETALPPDLASETAFLRRVSVAFVSSALVRPHGGERASDDVPSGA